MPPRPSCGTALDAVTDARLRAALKSVTHDATVVIVAQRVSTVMRADRDHRARRRPRGRPGGRHQELLGKTTVVNLLMRFYEIDSGRIVLDGTDYRDLGRDQVRRCFGMVLQDTWLSPARSGRTSGRQAGRHR